MSTQEIDFTAGTDSHPNDPLVEPPARVRQVAVPPAAHALSTLAHIDDEDTFLIEVDPDQERTGQQGGPSGLARHSDHHPNRAPVGVVALGLRLGST